MMYVLDEQGQPVPESDISRWSAFMQDFPRRIVAKTRIGDWEVSTVFLGADHNFLHHGGPVLWETMVFGPEPWTDSQWRYRTREEALAHHDQVAEHVRRGGNPEDV